MKNRTDIIGMSLPDRMNQSLRTHAALLALLATGAMGFLLSNSIIFGVMAPFGAALCAASSREGLPYAAVGAVLGYIFTFNLQSNMKYIIAVLFIVTARIVLGGWLPAHRRELALPLLSGGCVLGVSLLFLAVGGFSPYGVVLGCSEGMLAGGACYFFIRTLSVLELSDDPAPARRSDLSCVVITFGIVVAAITPLTVGGLSAGRILAVLAVLICARTGGEAYGAISGITAGVAVALADSRCAFLAGSYGIGGMMSGLFSPFGRLGCAAVWIVVNAVGLIFAGGQSLSPTPVYESFVASVLYMLLPARLLDRVRMTPEQAAPREQGLKTLLLDKLRFASRALREITETTREVSQRLSEKHAGEIGQVYQRAAGRVCRRCGFNSKCWQSDYTDTMNAFNDMTPLLRKKGSVSREDLPGYLIERCCRIDGLLETVNLGYAEYLSRSGTQRRVSQVRSVVTDQFEGMAMMLDEFAQELSDLNQINHTLSERAFRYFRELGTAPLACYCFEDDYGRLSLEAELPNRKLSRVNRIDSTLALSELCSRELDLPYEAQSERTTRLVYSEKPNYTVEHAMVQKSCGNSRLCGDHAEVFTETRGRTCAILSDGMGHGGGAAIDSAMAVSLLARLIRAGVSFDAALKMVNSAMLVKSGEESLATIDVAAVDLYSGRVDFYKAGAAPTYLLKGGRAGSVESTSLPAGILSGVAFETSTLSLQKGDTLLMVSDGVTAAGADWILPMLQSLREVALPVLCEQIASTAKLRRADGHEDDITVLALRLKPAL